MFLWKWERCREKLISLKLAHFFMLKSHLKMWCLERLNRRGRNLMFSISESFLRWIGLPFISINLINDWRTHFWKFHPNCNTQLWTDFFFRIYFPSSQNGIQSNNNFYSLPNGIIVFRRDTLFSLNPSLLPPLAKCREHQNVKCNLAFKFPSKPFIKS